MLKRLKKVKKRYIILGGIILAIIFLIVLRNSHTDAYTEYVVKKQTVSDELLLAGVIDAKDRVDLGFATSGRVKKVHFNVGESVKAGQVIVEIEQNRLQSELTQAQANYTLTRVDTSLDLESAEENLQNQLAEQESIVTGLYQTYLSGDLQAYSLDSNFRNIESPVISGSYFGDVEGEYVLDIYGSGSRSGYSFKLSGLETNTYTAETYQPGQLGISGLYIQFDADDSFANTEWVVPVPNTRSSTYIARKTAYENATKTRDRIISDLENTLDRVSSVDSSSQISRNEAQRQHARAQVNAVAAQLGDGKIRAPFDGIIAKNDLEIGEIVNAFTTEIIIFSNEEKELNLNTPEIYINKIYIGDTVNIMLDAYDDLVFTGTVDFIDFIDTEVDGVPVYKTDITLDDIDSRIRSGMNAKASIISEQRENVIAVPMHYINIKNNDTQTVLIKNGSSSASEERVITTGLRGNEGLVEVTSGLSEGDIILLVEKD